MGLLDGKKLLITGVVNRESIAYEVARQAQEAGAEVVLTSFGRQFRLTQVIARRLPVEAPVVQLDVTDAEDLAALADRVREAGLDSLDGVVQQGPVARFSRTPAEMRWAGREHNADTESVLDELD